MANEKQKTEKSLTVRQPRQDVKIFQVAWTILRSAISPFSVGRLFQMTEAMWAPAIHVLEKEDKFVAKVELTRGA